MYVVDAGDGRAPCLLRGRLSSIARFECMLASRVRPCANVTVRGFEAPTGAKRREVETESEVVVRRDAVAEIFPIERCD